MTTKPTFEDATAAAMFLFSYLNTHFIDKANGYPKGHAVVTDLDSVDRNIIQLYLALDEFLS